MKRGRRAGEKGSRRKSRFSSCPFSRNLLGFALLSKSLPRDTRTRRRRIAPLLYFHLVSLVGESNRWRDRIAPLSLSLFLEQPPPPSHRFVFSFRRMFTGARARCASADLFSARRPSIRRVALLFRATTTNAKNAPLPRHDSSSSAAAVAGAFRFFGGLKKRPLFFPSGSEGR